MRPLGIFYDNPRFLIVSLLLLFIAGITSYRALPHSEDPRLTQRYGSIITRYPGSTAERVDSLVTEKIEAKLLELGEVAEVDSVSQAGLSLITVRLADAISGPAVIRAWARVRQKVSEAAAQLPTGASTPDLDDDITGTSTLIAALIWTGPDQPPRGMMRRFVEELESELRNIPGTEKLTLYGEPIEEVLVEVDATRFATLGITASDLAQAVWEADSKGSAGILYSSSRHVPIQVAGELDSLSRIASIPVTADHRGQILRLGDIATVDKRVQDPPAELAILDGHYGIAVAARMLPGERIEWWTESALRRIEEFRSTLPPKLECVIVFKQRDYTAERLNSLMWSLAAGIVLVVGASCLLLGWRPSLVVTLMLPLTILFVLLGMRLLNLAIHQMSIIGIIIALGMLIDNAIIVVDEVRQLISEGRSAAQAIEQTLQRLAVPLLGSTVTSILAFMPAVLMPGAVGESMRAMAITVVLALVGSYILALAVVPAIMGYLSHLRPMRAIDRIVGMGAGNKRLLRWYESTLDSMLAHPKRMLAVAPVLSLAGFYLGMGLPQQVFPDSDRNQFPLQIELPAGSSILRTRDVVRAMSENIEKHPEVDSVHWFLGTAFPPFYYNVIGHNAAAPNLAQAIVTLAPGSDIAATIRDIQRTLDKSFPQCQAIATQLGQGTQPAAPIEVSVRGPDLQKLSQIGKELRAELASIPGVIHTRSTLVDGQPKLLISLDEESAKSLALSNVDIADQLRFSLQGFLGGSLLEDAQELPVRVRVRDEQRGRLSDIQSLSLLTTTNSVAAHSDWVPVTALGQFALVPEFSQIPRRNGVRSNTVQAFLPAATVPSTVFDFFAPRLREFESRLPAGYSLLVGGEAETRGRAMGNLLAYVGLLITLMVATLVLSLGSFRLTAIIGTVALQSVGFGLFALWLSGYALGFSPILGLIGLIGVSINDSIVVISALHKNALARSGDRTEIRRLVVRSTRHVIATSATTMAGLSPLMFTSGNLWPPLAITIGVGVAGATILALFFTPVAYTTAMGFGQRRDAFVSGSRTVAPG